MINQKKIFDKDVSFSNYLRFKKCRLIKELQSVEFIYANGKKYQVPFSEIRKWFKRPHYYLRNGVRIKFGNQKYKVSKNPKPIRVRRILKGSGVRIYFNDKTACDVAWDTVLMACEPAYEHYGGLKKR